MCTIKPPFQCSFEVKEYGDKNVFTKNLNTDCLTNVRPPTECNDDDDMNNGDALHSHAQLTNVKWLLHTDNFVRHINSK